jgi:hypothetical protein
MIPLDTQDGWTAEAFHTCVDGYGPAVVWGRTSGGAVIGGYNPLGYDGWVAVTYWQVALPFPKDIKGLTSGSMRISSNFCLQAPFLDITVDI